mgnify:CR=1 FL=1
MYQLLFYYSIPDLQKSRNRNENIEEDQKMDTILTLVNKGNDFLWSFLLLILLCGTGIYYTIRLKFIQVRKFGEGCKHVFGHFSLNGEKA